MTLKGLTLFLDGAYSRIRRAMELNINVGTTKIEREVNSTQLKLTVRGSALQRPTRVSEVIHPDDLVQIPFDSTIIDAFSYSNNISGNVSILLHD